MWWGRGALGRRREGRHAASAGARHKRRRRAGNGEITIPCPARRQICHQREANVVRLVVRLPRRSRLGVTGALQWAETGPPQPVLHDDDGGSDDEGQHDEGNVGHVATRGRVSRVERSPEERELRVAPIPGIRNVLVH